MIPVYLTADEWNVVVQLLAEQPYKFSAALIQKIVTTVQEQQQKSNVEMLDSRRSGE
jgi:hypothetical protein